MERSKERLLQGIVVKMDYESSAELCKEGKER